MFESSGSDRLHLTDSEHTETVSDDDFDCFF